MLASLDQSSHGLARPTCRTEPGWRWVHQAVRVTLVKLHTAHCAQPCYLGLKLPALHPRFALI